MLTIPLIRLEHQGSLDIDAAVPSDDPAWEGTDFHFSGSLLVSGQAFWISSGDVLVRLTLRGVLLQECRRCLAPVDVQVDERMELFFRPTNGSEELEGDSFRPLPHGAMEVDLLSAIREELVLSLPMLALCAPDCRGLCPRCGRNLNEERCECSAEELDPRWDVLRALNQKRD